MTSQPCASRLQLEEFQQQLRKLRERGAVLADQMANSAERLKSRGILPQAGLLEEIEAIRVARDSLCQQLEDHPEFEVPQTGRSADLITWEQSLGVAIEHCIQLEAAERQRRAEHLQALREILELKTNAEPQHLDSVLDCARDLQKRLIDDSTWHDAMSTPDLPLLGVFHELVQRTRQQRQQEPEALELARQLTDRFGLFLTLQLYSGCITSVVQAVEPLAVPIATDPAPLEPDSQIPEHSGDDVLRPIVVAPEPLPVDTTGSVEAVVPERAVIADPFPVLQTVAADPVPVAKNSEVITLRPVAAEVPHVPFDFQEGHLESIEQRLRKRAEAAQKSRLSGESSCLDTMALSIEYMRDILHAVPRTATEWPIRMQDALQGLVHCQTALTRMRETKGLAGDDADQNAIRAWLTRIHHGTELKVPVAGSGGENPELGTVTEIEAELRRQLQDLRKPARVRKTLDAISQRLLQSTGSGEEARTQWEAVIANIEHLVLDEQLAPGHREIREALLPHIGDVPEGLPESRSFRQVLAEIERYQADWEARQGWHEESIHADDIQRVADTLRGKRIVMIGGIPNPETKAHLLRTFGLQDVIWEQIADRGSPQRLQPIIQEPGVSLVLILLRWVGFGHAEDLKVYCQASRKPFVLVPGGYTASQLATAIMATVPAGSTAALS